MSKSDPVHDRKNVELKARIAAIEQAVEVCRQLGATDRGLLVQTDTYFYARVGRLKLREITGSHSELIWYERADTTDARSSRYQLTPVHDPDALKASLSGALGVRGIVRKRRRLFLFENVRIHVDDVDGLGAFMEFEAVCGPGEAEADQYPKLARLREAFGIRVEDEITTSYGDLVKTSASEP